MMHLSKSALPLLSILFYCAGLFAAVEFLGLDVLQEHENVRLEWSTSSERQNLGYILERKTDSTAAWDPLDHYIHNDLLLGQGTVSIKTDYAYIDSNVVSGTRYFYRLSGMDAASNIGYLDSVSILVTETRTRPLLPLSLVLNIYPNPFNAQITIDYVLHRDLRELYYRIYDIRGNMCFSGCLSGVERGNHRDVLPTGAWSSGVYFFNVRVPDERGKIQHITKKLLLLK
jgi:hypothetical protein